MRSGCRGGGSLLSAVLAFFLLGAAAPAAAQTQSLETTIDLNYTYEQEHLGTDVDAATGFQQKYQVKLATTLTSSLDFFGAITLDLDDKWDTDAAATSKVSPSLELGVKGPQSGAKFSYTGVLSTTEEYLDAPEATLHSNTATVDLELTPVYWPEVKFKLQEKRDYQEQRTDTANRTLELQLRDEFMDVQTEFRLKLDTTNDTLPERGVGETVEWGWKATYKRELPGAVEFEADYEVKETYSEDSVRGSFAADEEDYTQLFKSRLKKSLLLTPRLNADLIWEYSFDQDLLALEYDHAVQNKYELNVSYDALPSLKLRGLAKRETEFNAAVVGEDDTSSVADTLNGAFDFEPVSWLRIGGKAERQTDDSVEEGTGGSVDRTEDRQYDLTLKNRFSYWWDLAASTSGSWSYLEGELDDRESKFKAELRLKPLRFTWAEMMIIPGYTSTRKDSWDDRGEHSDQSLTTESKIKFELRSRVLDHLRLTFTHEYSREITEELNETLSFTRELTMDESTRINAQISELFEGLNLEGEIERKASDTEDDPDPQLIEVSYSLNLDWKYEKLSVASGFKYNDKGEDPDDLEFTVEAGWDGEEFDLSADYQFTKVYAETTEEARRLNLKLSWKF